MTFDTVRGFKDYTGEEALKREYVRRKVEDILKLYGFEPAETPVIEQEEFVKGENEFDEAVSDIFKLKDKGERNLALRYEFTFQLKRIAQNKKLPYKRYQIGYVFRDEPISANRFRQFTQCDADVVGSTIKDEAEVLATITAICKELNIEAEIQINSRKLMNSICKSLGIENVEYVLRELDKIDKQGEDLVKSEMTKFLDKATILKLFKALRQPLSTFKNYEGYKQLVELIDFCKAYNIKPAFKPTLARGLSYYNENIFEVKTKEIKETICGGGAFLSNNIQCFGYGAGLERLTQLAKINIKKKSALIVSINQDKKSIELAESLRKSNIQVSIMDKPGKAMDFADSQSIAYVIFLGSEEIKKKKFKLRDMKSGKEEMLGIKALIEKLK